MVGYFGWPLTEMAMDVPGQKIWSFPKVAGPPVRPSVKYSNLWKTGGFNQMSYMLVIGIDQEVVAV